MFFEVVFLDFQNFPKWGRRINATNTKMNGISESQVKIGPQSARWQGLRVKKAMICIYTDVSDEITVLILKASWTIFL